MRKLTIHIQKIIKYLDADFRHALAETVEEASQKGYVVDGKVKDDERLFSLFRERAEKNFNSREDVPDECVDIPEDK